MLAAMTFKLSLHTWTLDTTPLADVLRVAAETGWPAVELRRVDFVRAYEAGRAFADVIGLVRRSGLAVSAVGVEAGWMFADGAERRRLLEVFAESCLAASSLACGVVMSPVDRGPGPVDRAAESVCEVADIAARHGARLALEFNSQAEQINTLGRVREIVARADHPGCGLLVDSYHLHRSGAGPEALEPLAADEIAYVQFSDVPASGLQPGMATDRLPPGKGVVPFREFFRAVAARGYRGYASYEAPNPAAWARPPDDVAREALQAARAVL
jgi:sugar phosphate isomerase/epimerase